MSKHNDYLASLLYKDPNTGVIYANKKVYEAHMKFIKANPGNDYETVPYKDGLVMYKSKAQYDYQHYFLNDPEKYAAMKKSAKAREKEIKDAEAALEQDKEQIDYERLTGKRLRK